MTTASDLINKVSLRLAPTARDIVVSLYGAYTAGSTSIVYTDNSANGVAAGAIQIGTLLSVDLELFVVTGQPSGGAIPVSPGYKGSTPANHSSGALVHINPWFSDFQILQAINDDLDSLSSTENGLFQVSILEFTYVPVFRAFDLTDVNTSAVYSNSRGVIGVRYKTPLPDRKYIGIPDGAWEITPIDSIDTNFPSGYQFVINGDYGYPGQPVQVIYKQAFTHLVNYTDNVTITGLPTTAYDLPVLGAMLILVPPREVRRNDPGSQPDSRLATEVPFNSIQNSIAGVDKQRERRIEEEAANLKTVVNSYRRRF